MANAGYSADYQLCRELSAKNKYINHHDEDDKIITTLKNYVNDYIYVRNNKDKFPGRFDRSKKHKRFFNSWQHRCDNIIIEMNQLRQRNWYWKTIK